jgi:uncharacterized protein
MDNGCSVGSRFFMAIKKNRRTKRKTKKSQGTIPASKTAFLCGGIILGCVIMLLLNTLFSPGQRSEPAEKDTSEAGVSAEPVKQQEQPAVLKPAAQPEQTPVPESGNMPSAVSVEPSATVPEKKQQTRERRGSDVVQKTTAVVSVAELGKKSRKKQSSSAKVSPTGKLLSFPEARNGAKLVFVFDDAGQNLSQLEKYVSLPFPVTVAVLPQLQHSVACARRVRVSGNEVMLHQPMQAVNEKVYPGPGAVTPAMQTSEISLLVKKNIAEIGPVAGVNNHEGSLICEDELKIGAVMEAAKESGAYFLDSRTTNQTRVPQASMGLGIGYYERNVFLDNTQSRNDIIKELRRGLDIANTKGSVIMIGHVWSADVLPGILIELYPELKSKGYMFTTVSKSGALIRP